MNTTDQTRLLVLAPQNPKRQGTDSHRRFGLYKSGITVDEYVRQGGRRADVRWDAQHGYIGLRPTRRSVQHA